MEDTEDDNNADGNTEISARSASQADRRASERVNFVYGCIQKYITRMKDMRVEQKTGEAVVDLVSRSLGKVIPSSLSQELLLTLQAVYRTTGMIMEEEDEDVKGNAVVMVPHFMSQLASTYVHVHNEALRLDDDTLTLLSGRLTVSIAVTGAVMKSKSRFKDSRCLLTHNAFSWFEPKQDTVAAGYVPLSQVSAVVHKQVSSTRGHQSAGTIELHFRHLKRIVVILAFSSHTPNTAAAAAAAASSSSSAAAYVKRLGSKASKSTKYEVVLQWLKWLRLVRSTVEFGKQKSSHEAAPTEAAQEPWLEKGVTLSHRHSTSQEVNQGEKHSTAPSEVPANPGGGSEAAHSASPHPIQAPPAPPPPPAAAAAAAAAPGSRPIPAPPSSSGPSLAPAPAAPAPGLGDTEEREDASRKSSSSDIGMLSIFASSQPKGCSPAGLFDSEDDGTSRFRSPVQHADLMSDLLDD